MDRADLIAFISKEAERLTNEENVNELANARDYEELMEIKIQVTRQMVGFSPIRLTVQNIPKGMFLSVAMIINVIGYDNFNDFDNPTLFAKNLAEEAGKIGKSIANLMLSTRGLSEIQYHYFFTDRFYSTPKEDKQTQKKS